MIPSPPAAHTELTTVIELIGDLKDTAVSVFRVIIHKSKINAAILLLGNSFGPSLQIFPLLIGEKVCNIKYILHRDTALHRFFHAGILAGAGRRAICADVILRRFLPWRPLPGSAPRRSLVMSSPFHARRRHIGAVPHRRRRRTIPGRCPAHRSVWRRRTSHFRQPSVGIPILRFQQNGQRNALLVLAIAVIIFLIDPRGGGAKSVIAVLGQY